MFRTECFALAIRSSCCCCCCGCWPLLTPACLVVDQNYGWHHDITASNQAADARKDILNSDFTSAAEKLASAIKAEAEMGYME